MNTDLMVQFAGAIRERLVACRNGAVARISIDSVSGPFGGRAVVPSRVIELASDITRFGFKQDEPIVVCRMNGPELYWCVNGNYRLHACHLAGLLDVPCRMPDLDNIVVDGICFDSNRYPGLVVSVVEETEARAQQYTVLQEANLILSFLPSYKQYIEGIKEHRTRAGPVVKAPQFAKWLRSFVSFAHFFPATGVSLIMIHENAQALFKYERIVSMEFKERLACLESEGKLQVSFTAFRRTMDQNPSETVAFLDFLLGYDISSGEVLGMTEHWRQLALNSLGNRNSTNNSDVKEPPVRRSRRAVRRSRESARVEPPEPVVAH